MIRAADADGVVFVQGPHHLGVQPALLHLHLVRVQLEHQSQRARPSLADQFLRPDADLRNVLAVLVKLPDVQGVMLACIPALEAIQTRQRSGLDSARQAVDGLRRESDQAAGLHEFRRFLDPIQVSLTATDFHDFCCHNIHDTQNDDRLQVPWDREYSDKPSVAADNKAMARYGAKTVQEKIE